MKREATEWKKTFANHISNKGLVFKICKELQFNGKKVNDTVKKRPKYLTKHFTIEGIWLADKPTESYSASLVTREMQIKISIRYHYSY